MTKNIVKTESELPVAQVPQAGEVIGSDVLIPRLLLMQGISPLVIARKAQLGELIRSTTAEKLGDPEHPVTIIPLKMVSTWTNYEIVGQKGEYRSSEPRTASNEKLEWEYKKNGTTWNRKKTITLFALLPSDVSAYDAEIKRAEKSGEAPDLNRTVMPVVITFQSTSFKYAGKKCASFFNNIQVNARRIASIKPYQYSLELQSKADKNNKGSYYVYDLGNPVAVRDKAVLQAAADWAEVLGGSGNIRTDDSGEVAESGDDAITEV